MNFAMIDATLIDALPWLIVLVFIPLLILAGVFGSEWLRLAGEDDDYGFGDLNAPVAVLHEWTGYRRLNQTPMVLGPGVTFTPLDVLPPAPPGMNAGAPIAVELTARHWLRKLGEEARDKAGIRPAYATDARDMTGAFPVVRAA